ncbi:Mitochondrial grpe [Mycena indigotica]|uniref:GrpE protein homolog, mitochondrial n=1 Tax=Mycena indigotica TaxID=2126181 RepID=A0A8H6SA56_9AGAR|nr:Mitochondrial grpe [Mycena indigotica]KAF7294926.1 Mitochondrial grpe [Mycena indigotica]
MSLLRTTSLSCARRFRPAFRLYSDAATAGESSTEPPKDDAPKVDAALVKAQEEAADLLSRLRYLQADFLNLQRNSAREREKTRDFAVSNFAADLLETVDVLSLALKSVPQSAFAPSETPEGSLDTPTTPPAKSAKEHLQELYTGVEMTQRQLLQTLFKYHVKPFDPTGDAFDPNRHEALYQAPIPGKTPGTVIDCQKIGFTIRDRVLRAAQVGVAQDVPQNSEEPHT